MKCRRLLSIAGVLLFAGAAKAQLADEFNVPPANCCLLNTAKSYAAQANATYVDYFSALVDEKGWMKDGIANDGPHPNAEEYKIMAPIVSAAIERVVR